MELDGMVQIIKPEPDSHFRLVPCRCGSDNVAYVLGVDGQWHGQCFDCGLAGTGDLDRHEAQVKWNRGMRDGGYYDLR